jgi:hypothetical protein
VTKPIRSPIYCSVCGREMGTKSGVQVVLGLVCDDPICNYQPPASVNAARDGRIVAAVLEKIPVAQIAFATGITRQRIYQIFESWKGGI